MEKSKKKTSVSELIEHMEEVAFMERADVVRFTVTLTERHNRRLEYLARRYGAKRAEMARDLLLAAINDAEDTLGLDTLDDSNDKPTDYYYYLSGKISLDDLFKGQAQKEGEE